MGFFSGFDVFISYSRANQDRVVPLVDQLRTLGYRVFFDQDSIPPGDWEAKLERSVRQARAMIVCWSQEAKASEHVQFEWHKAIAHHKIVIPWLLDATPLPKLLDKAQAVTKAEPAAVTAVMARELGWSAPRRRTFAGIAAVLAVLAGAGYALTRPPVTWQFEGEVRDGSAPVAGMQVDWLDAPADAPVSASSDAGGRVLLVIPGERPRQIRLLFHNAGYCEEVNAATELKHVLTLSPSYANGC